jgi:predicted ribosome quality control (RQC) complex YloA/Tae2 family protein
LTQTGLSRTALAVNNLLIPGWVQKVWQDEEERVLFRLRAGQKSYQCLLSSLPGLSGFGIVESRQPSAVRPRALLSYLRAHLEGGTLTGIAADPERRLLVFCFLAKSKPLYLVLDLSEKSPKILALDSERVVRASTTQGKGSVAVKHGEKFPALPEPRTGGFEAVPEPGEDLEFLVKAGELLSSVPVQNPVAAETAKKRWEKKVLKRIGNIRADIERAGDPDELRRRADLLAGSLYRVNRGLERIEIETPEGGVETVDLDSARTPGENLELLYKKASKAKRARKIASERLLAAEKELESPPPEAKSQDSRKNPGRESSRPFLRYRSSDGYPILAGRNGPENMRLLREARPWDIWLHARDGAGAHVLIVKPGKEAKIPERTLAEAAGVAALRSRFAAEGAVDVMYVEAARVSRVKGGSPGKVLVSGEKTIRVPPGAGAPKLLER